MSGSKTKTKNKTKPKIVPHTKPRYRRQQTPQISWWQTLLVVFLAVAIMLGVLVPLKLFWDNDKNHDSGDGANPQPPVAPVTPVTVSDLPLTGRASFDQTVGACGFIDDSIDNVLSGVGLVREYHNYRWITETPGQCRFSIPKNYWNWDEYYRKLVAQGIEPVPCIQGTSQADRRHYNGNKQQKPINSDEDSLAAASYAEHAATMFQYAARYGHVKVADAKLNLESGQERVSGLGYLNYYENWNEPDKTWEGDECHFSGAEYAAMCSADYDGDEGRLGDQCGLKTADPQAKLVMGGVAGGRWTTDYLDEMLAWAQDNRTDQKLPLDVINFHMYSGKLHPEAYEYIANFNKICAWRDQHAPQLEIWLTEFGWDTNPDSPNGATTTQQRDWLMRTYLLANAHGIDRATMYMTRDTSSASSKGKYATSGLVKNDKKTKKVAWYGVATLKNTLKDYYFRRVVTETDDVYNYEYFNPRTGTLCYVVWRPTATGTTTSYQLTLGTDITSATLTTVTANSTTGTMVPLTVNDGQVVLTVNETPQFIKVKAAAPFGVWWWSDQLDSSYLDFAQAQGVTEIYYCSSKFNATTNDFIQQANQRGMLVYWLAGEYQWVTDRTGLEKQIAKYLVYQRNYRYNFAGIHLDIEPQQHPQWHTQRLTLLQQYVELVAYLAQNYPQLWLEYDLQFSWEDDLTFNAVTKPVFAHIMDYASRVTLMSYRDTAAKIYQVAAAEIAYAQETGKRLNLGVETYSTEGNQVSFREEGQTVMFQELQKLRTMIPDDFGIVVHEIKKWRQLPA